MASGLRSGQQSQLTAGQAGDEQRWQQADDGRWQPADWRYARRGPATDAGLRRQRSGPDLRSAFEPVRPAFAPVTRSALDSASRSADAAARPRRGQSFPVGKVIAAVFAFFAVIIIYSAVKSESSPTTVRSTSSSTGPAATGSQGISP
jgi:hypothetical protein